MTPRTELIEREDALERVHRCIAGARQGQPGMLLVDGIAGIGKTALVETALSWQPAAATRVARVAGAQSRQGIAFGGIAGLLSDAVADADQHAVFAGAAANARPIFDGTRAAADTELLGRLHGLYWLLANLADDGPLVLWIDDAHWLDRPTALFLEHLAPRLDDLPLAIVVTRRPGTRGEPSYEPLERLAGAVDRLELMPLSGQGVAELVGRSALGKTDDAERLARDTGGVPLFVHAALEGPIAGGAADPIADLVAALADESDAQARLLAALAVLERAAPAAVAAIATLPPDDADHSLEVLIERGIVTSLAGSTGWAHPLLRQAMLDRIDLSTRQELHRAASAWFVADGEDALAAQHLLAAGPGALADAEARTLLVAIDHARAHGGEEEVLSLGRHALAGAGSANEQQRCHEVLGSILAHRRDPAGIDHLVEARRLASDPDGQARASLRLGHALFWNGRFEESQRLCREAAAAADGELALLLEAEAISSELLQGRERSRPATFEPRVSGATTVGERAVLVHVAGDLAARGTRPASQVAALARAAAGGDTLLREVGPDSPMLPFLVTTLTWSEDFEAAGALVGEGDRLARASGSVVGIAYAAALRAGVRHRLGQLLRARQDAELVLDDYPASDPLATMSALAFEIEALVDQGQAGDVLQRVDMLGLGGELPVLGTVDFLLLARGWARVCSGDVARGTDDIEEVGRRATVAEYPNPAGLCWRGRLARAIAVADPERAQVLAEEEVVLAERFEAPRAHGIALHAAGLVGAPTDRVERLEQARAILARSAARLEEARCEIDLGLALVDAGHVGDAQTPLRAGMTLAHECGATGEVDRALAGLRRTGLRPRRPATRGIDALTSHERQAADLAVEGLTNREIAERLYVTLRTVEQHLSKSYRKLGIGGRADLAGALDAVAA